MHIVYTIGTRMSIGDVNIDRARGFAFCLTSWPRGFALQTHDAETSEVRGGVRLRTWCWAG